MSNLILSISGIYLFIILGYFGKLKFKDRLDEKSIVLISIYLLQPLLVFWGLTKKPIDSRALDASTLFLLSSAILLMLSWGLSRLFLSGMKERSVATVAGVIGNTGNLGIPIGIALFGEDSILYTSIINMVNVFIVYTVGVYFYSRGNFSVIESIKNIFKLPAIWFGIGAIFFNISAFEIPHSLELPLKMGAYSTMVLQLMIFGIYLATVHSEKIDISLSIYVVVFKFIITPIFIYLLLFFIDIDTLVRNVLILEMIVPLAVMNVNLAALYDSLPKQVAFLTFITSVIFLIYLFVATKMLFVY